MITVFICDDSKISAEFYAGMIEDIAKTNNIDISITCFYSGEELLFHLSDAVNQADIIYLDILMRQVNGMDTAKRLRKMGCKSEIIFLTASEDFVYEAFDIEAINYLLKTTTSKDKFEEVFLRAANLSKDKYTDMFITKTGSTKIIIPYQDIRYFEIERRIVTVHYEKDKTREFYSSMKLLAQQVTNKNFVRVHQAYLVNLRYVSSMAKSSLILKCGKKIPIGVTYAENTRIAFDMFTTDENRK